MNALAEIIRGEIQKAGIISFERFMELALYSPQVGYYERGADPVGRRGDFLTSVSAGPMFGNLLGFWMAAEFRRLACDRPVIVEAGAHHGALATDILHWFKKQEPELYSRLGYCIVEPSTSRRAMQEASLAGHRERVRWTRSLEELGSVRGVIFSNELLDAFPVKRWHWSKSARAWREVGVLLEAGRYGWGLLPPQLPFGPRGEPPALPMELLEVLPEGFTTETSPEASRWYQAAANALGGGKLLTVDYGWENDAFFSPERSNGTVRAYSRHHLSDDLLANPGEQDLTAMVNFTQMRQVGESRGLQTELDVTQEHFLVSIAREIWANHEGKGWRDSERRAFQTLIHPEHFGRAFRVLVQAR